MSLQVGYLINQYPKVSHSFIRREILALETQGHKIFRYALRGWSETFPDGEDEIERQSTQYLLRAGIFRIAFAVLLQFIRSPVRFCGVLRSAFSMSRGAERSLLYQLVYLAEACLLVAWCARDRVAHLHAHFGTNSATVAMMTRSLGGPPYSFTVHGPEEFDKVAAINLAQKIEKAAFVVAVSSFGRSQLFRWTRSRDWDRIKIVRCGLGDDYLKSAPTAIGQSRTMVCVGRLCEQKGQLLLIHAVNRLVRSGVEMKLVLAGDGDMREQIERLVLEFHLEQHVRITGWIDAATVRQELMAARALVLPSFAEGLPVVIMEAMALSRPVLSTYVAGIPELVIPGKTGWLFAAGDVDGLALAMQDCLSLDASSLNNMGAAGQIEVMKRHSAQIESAALAKLFFESISEATA